MGKNDRTMEGFMTHFAAAQREFDVAFDCAEDKRLNVMLKMEERRQEKNHVREMAMWDAEQSHEEKMMKMMFMIMNPGHPVQHYQTPQMTNYHKSARNLTERH